MKMLSLVLLSILLMGVAGVTMAAKPDKSTILHCGCDWDGEFASMIYSENTISAKSRGHDGHVAATIDSCYAGQEEVDAGVFADVYVDFVRSGDDCQVSGPPLGDPISDCPLESPPVAGDICGAELNIQ